MKKLGMIILPALFAAISILLSACQATPEKSAVTSKNDGTLEAALESTPSPAEETDAGTEPAVYEDSFTGEFGGRYTVSVEEPDRPAALPVYKVRPMEITSEMAERIARGLLGEDTVFYEQQSVRSKEQLEEMILSMRQFIGDWDALVEACEGDEALAESTKEYYEKMIAAAEAQYETASDQLEPPICTWELHDPAYYEDPLHPGVYSDDYRLIHATATVDGVVYKIYVTNEESSDHRTHDFAMTVTTDTERSDTGKSQDLEALRTQALAIAEAMDIGSWEVDNYYPANGVNTSMLDYEGSDVRVTLTRVYDGVKVIYNVAPMHSDDIYAPVYDYEALSMVFRDGALMELMYTGPLEIVETVNENVPILSFDEALSIAETEMKREDSYSWDLPSGGYAEHVVDQAELGLVRVRIKNNATEYYLIPAYEFNSTRTGYNADGTVATEEAQRGEQVFSIKMIEENRQEVIVNAVDGSVYDSWLGY